MKLLTKINDHVNRSLQYEYPPKKIISIAPGITETLYALELDKEMIGRTRYCIYPADKVKRAEIVGGTKDIDLEKIKMLQPDLILAEKEENTKEIVEQLEEFFPVFVAEVQSVKGAYRMIDDMGKLTGKENTAKNLLASIQSEFENLPQVKNKRAAYVIWRNPNMVVGRDTYINSLLSQLGYMNPFANLSSRYPVVTEEELKEAELDTIFLATEPFHFKEKRIKEFQQFLPEVNPLIVNGEMFWYGAKMKEAVSYLRKLVSEQLNSE